MNQREVFELVVSLEKDLSDFYQEIGQMDNLKQWADIFSYMTDHSANHASRIKEVAAAIEMPVLKTTPIRELHQRLKSSLREQIQNEEDTTKVLDKLAQTEEIVGRLYQSIGEHYRKLEEVYGEIAEKFETLAEEEYGHRDYILEES